MKALLLKADDAPKEINFKNEDINNSESKIQILRRMIGNNLYDFIIDKSIQDKRVRIVTAFSPSTHETIIRDILIVKEYQNNIIIGLSDDDINTIYKNMMCNILMNVHFDVNGLCR